MTQEKYYAKVANNQTQRNFALLIPKKRKTKKKKKK